MRLSKLRVCNPMGVAHTVTTKTSLYWAWVWPSGSTGGGGAALPPGSRDMGRPLRPRIRSWSWGSVVGGRSDFGCGLMST